MEGVAGGSMWEVTGNMIVAVKESMGRMWCAKF